MKEKLKKLDIENFLSYEVGDAFVEVSQIRAGDVIYECDNHSAGLNYEFRAITDAQPSQKGWVCKLQDSNGERFDIYVSGGTKGNFLPKFYRVPQYLEREGEKFFYPVK